MYLDASDGTYLHTSLEDSSIRIGEADGVSKAAIISASATIGIVRYSEYPDRLVLLDEDEPVALGERLAYRESIATGDSPSAIAVMP